MKKTSPATLLTLVIGCLLQVPVAADGLGGSEQITSPIPDALQGAFPIETPRLDGVEQLLVLSNQWVIVVSNRMDALFAEIDRLSGGELSSTAKLPTGGASAASPDWKAIRINRKIRDKYIAEAREKIGELRLGETGFFTIQSDSDTAYKTPIHPVQADRLYVSEGQSRSSSGLFDIDYNIYSYLQFPSPMVDGHVYTIRLGDGGSVTFLFDRKHTVSRAIKVNQVGYLTNAGRKRAYLGADLYRFGPLDLSSVKHFEVINAATGQVALQGPVELLEANPRFAPRDKSNARSERPLMYGEDVYVVDFSKLKEEGVFFISVPGVGRSWPFIHSASVYGPAFYTSMRGLFHQRAGMPISREYSAWTRKKINRGPYCESQHISFPKHTGSPKGYNRFDTIGGSMDCSSTTEEIPGGWHDAADWDSNDGHYTVIFDLLNAYAFDPKRFADAQLHFPESGNGVPDILDEVRYGLEIWRHSMDQRGGVSGMLETWTHPQIDDDVNYAFAQRTRWSSLMFAAAAAQYAQLVKPFDTKDSDLYAQAAKRAYTFGNNVTNSLGTTTIQAKSKRGRGEPYSISWTETEEHVAPYLLHAKLRLYLLTHDQGYLDGVPALVETSKKPYQWGFTRNDFSPWIYFSLIEASEALPKAQVSKWRQFFIEDADNLVSLLDESPYSITWPRKQDFWMGYGATVMTNYNRGLFVAYQLTGDDKYRDAAILNLDFMLGANPMGMSWTTGLGMVYPIDIQHKFSEIDAIYDPVPGITIYGINGGPIYREFKKVVWESPGAAGPVDFVSDESQKAPPVWRRWMSHPYVNTAQNEFTVHETMSSTIFSTAMLVPDGWMPDADLLNKIPRDPDKLYGRWYLP